MMPRPITSLLRQALWSNRSVYRLYRCFRFHDFRVEEKDFDYWIAGYPRSSNTYSAQCLRAAARDKKVAMHLHVPTMVIPAWRSRKPGIFIVREPKAAAISWSIYRNQSLDWSLRYYIDFHRFLLPLQQKLFIASFGETTRGMDRVLGRFATSFNLELAPITINESFVNDRFDEIERYWHAPGEAVNELQVARPSKLRSEMTSPYESQIRRSRVLQTRLREAEALHVLFMKPNQFTIP